VASNDRSEIEAKSGGGLGIFPDRNGLRVARFFNVPTQNAKLGGNNMIDNDTTITIGLDHSTLNCPPSSFGDPDPNDLDRLAASLHALAACRCEAAADQPCDHVAIVSVGDHEQLLGGAVRIAGE
jgi:hypothetical protein